MKFLIGADPEVFVFDNEKQEYVSGHGLIHGDKKNPQPVKDGAVQVDGMALEYNIKPATCAEEFIANIRTVQGELQRLIGDRYSLHAVPSVEFSKEVWEATPDEAKVLGCDPDFNAWEYGEANKRPLNKGTMRTGAGHIHIGWTSDVDTADPGHLEACCMLTKQLDVSVGVSSLAWDKDNRRRLMYGKAGAFRPKHYGCEYRVLSNAWLNSDDAMKWVYTATVKAAEDLLAQRDYANVVGANNAVKAINTAKGNGCVEYSRILNIYYNFPNLPDSLKAA